MSSDRERRGEFAANAVRGVRLGSSLTVRLTTALASVPDLYLVSGLAWADGDIPGPVRGSLPILVYLQLRVSRDESAGAKAIVRERFESHMRPLHEQGDRNPRVDDSFRIRRTVIHGACPLDVFRQIWLDGRSHNCDAVAVSH